jgi:hypothetical protein
MSGWITPPNVVPVVVAVIFVEFVGHCLDVAPYLANAGNRAGPQIHLALQLTLTKPSYCPMPLRGLVSRCRTLAFDSSFNDATLRLTSTRRSR